MPKEKLRTLVNTCECCGKTFEIFASRVQNGRGKYCSKRCIVLSRKKRASEKFLKQTRKQNDNGCILWTGSIKKNGYGSFGVMGKTVLPHRYAWELVNGPIPNGLLVCHKCDTPLCVNVEHLFLGTYNDNIQDAVKKGRIATGERHGSRTHPESLRRGSQNGNATLTEKDVLSIKQKYQNGETNISKFSRDYGVSRKTIRCIINNQTWKHVK